MSRTLFEVCQKCTGRGRLQIDVGNEHATAECPDCHGLKFNPVGITMEYVHRIAREHAKFKQFQAGLALLKEFFLSLPADDKALDSLLGDVADERGIR